MRATNVKFDFDDILIEPKVKTTITSRFNDINPYYEGKTDSYFPVFTAPMDSVVDLDNMYEYLSLNIPVVLPRTVTYSDYCDFIKSDLFGAKYMKDYFPDFTFLSMSLNEFEKWFTKVNIPSNPIPNFVLIDTANGHLESILESVKQAKELHPDMVIMVGNIANPETYRWYAESEAVDYVRIGIGNGNGCLTTQQTGIGFPKASLIAECRAVKDQLESMDVKCPMIVADGGMKDYSDIIKALGVGADYVMVGSIFNKAVESSGENYLYGYKISNKLAEQLYGKFPVKKKFYGMSTKIAQQKLGNTVLKTSEGVVRYRKIEYTLNKWVDNFEHYLRSAMSYSDARTLEEFIGNVDYNLISENAFNRFNK